jgi:hypothetical protein
MTDRRESIACPHAQSEIDSSRRYVAYYRVSTGRQGRFGFSVEGQRAAVHDYVAKQAPRNAATSITVEGVQPCESKLAHVGLTRRRACGRDPWRVDTVPCSERISRACG